MQQPASAVRGWHNKRTRGWRKRRQRNNQLCYLPPHHFGNTWRCGFFVCCTAMAICSVVFGRVTMAIGGVVFISLTAAGIRGIVVHRGTSVVDIVVFCHVTPLWQYTALSSAAQSRQCAANTTISQKRDARQRCI
jgi:hypothetical protein